MNGQNTVTEMGSIPVISVDDAVKLLAVLYGGFMSSKKGLAASPSVMLWGPPGAGKSQLVRQGADVLSAMTGKKVIIIDVRLLLYNPIDLKGMPTANADKTMAVWLKPEIFNMDPSPDIIYILFLDEITAAPQSVQAAAYQITLDRKIGEHRLPDNCIVIAAGNRVTDKSVAYKMPRALANRMLHLEIETSYESWHRWAVANGINSKITGFLSFRPDYLMNQNANSGDTAFATPRSWEMASNILNCVDEDIDKVFPLIAGQIGTGTAVELLTWSKVYRELPSIEGIFNGECPPVPKKPDVIYALISAMTQYASEHRNELSRIANSIAYADRLPPDFAAVLMQDYIYIEEGYKDKLMQIPEFISWITSKGALLNGIR